MLNRYLINCLNDCYYLIDYFDLLLIIVDLLNNVVVAVDCIGKLAAAEPYEFVDDAYIVADGDVMGVVVVVVDVKNDVNFVVVADADYGDDDEN